MAKETMTLADAINTRRSVRSYAPRTLEHSAIAALLAAACWLSAENLMLAARAVGLGICVIGSAIPSLEYPEGKGRTRDSCRDLDHNTDHR